MGKMSELSLLLDEYREANRHAAELAEEISAMLTGTEPPAHEAHEEAKPLTLEEVGRCLRTSPRTASPHRSVNF